MYLINSYTSQREHVTAEKAIELYSDYVNNYAHIRNQAEHLNVTYKSLKSVIYCGRMLHEIYALHTVQQNSVI